MMDFSVGVVSGGAIQSERTASEEPARTRPENPKSPQATTAWGHAIEFE
jgi:hypothetical protein